MPDNSKGTPVISLNAPNGAPYYITLRDAHLLLTHVYGLIQQEKVDPTDVEYTKLLLDNMRYLALQAPESIIRQVSQLDYSTVAPYLHTFDDNENVLTADPDDKKFANSWSYLAKFMVEF